MTEKTIATGDSDVTPVSTSNDFGLVTGQNLPNHSASVLGRGAFVRQSTSLSPTFRDRQTAYRYAAYLITMAELFLPNDEGCEAHDFTTVLAAIQNG